jgi:hypothetical protein
VKTNRLKFIKGSTLSICLALIASLLLSVAAFAGGPANRTTYTSANPADEVVFNAITDNPEHGDERNFVLIREAGVGSYVNEIQLASGKRYEVYSYFHNNAKSRLNTEANGGVGIARNVRMYTQVPSVVKPGEKGKISTTIKADNANPLEVWDEAYVTTTETVALKYVRASAIIHSGGAINGAVLSENLFNSTGTFLGWSELNGILPGCADYAGYVIYQLEAVAEEKPDNPDTPDTPSTTTPDTPPPVTELPKTGPVEAALAVLAVLAITIGVVYWYKSRVDMRKVALGDDSKKATEPTTSHEAEIHHKAEQPEQNSEHQHENQDK